MFMVAFYFVLSVINNYALGFNIPMPLHMIFRAVSNYIRLEPMNLVIAVT